MAKMQYYGTGRRKSSVARVRLIPGKGNVTINKKSLDDYFGMEILKREVLRPFEIAGVVGKFDIVAFSWIGTPYPLGNIDQIYGTGSDSNFAQLSMPKVDELVDQIAVEMDKAKRLEMADEVAREIWTNVHTLPLYQRPMLIGVRDDMANLGALAFGTAKWENIGYVAE